ncbi:MAG: hypothetical protein C0592_00715 [Marinilabiliales bacterium]|nr:MAG: hypothetical protein C0592_00715 [Marinilabiliales bacterium]
MSWVSIIEMNKKIQQNRELKKNATKSRLSYEPVKYKKKTSNKPLKELTQADKIRQKERVQEYREFIKRRNRVTWIIFLGLLGLILLLLSLFVL